MGCVDFWSKLLESTAQVSRVWIAHQMCIWSLSRRHGGNVVTALPWKLVCQMYQHAFSSRMESPVHVTCWDHHHHCHTFHGASKLPTIKFAYIEKSIAMIASCSDIQMSQKKNPLLSSTYVPALWVYRNWMTTHHSIHGFLGFVASCQISCWSNIYVDEQICHVSLLNGYALLRILQARERENICFILCQDINAKPLQLQIFWLELWFDVSIVIIQAYHSNPDIRIHSLEPKQEIINDRWCIEWMWVLGNWTIDENGTSGEKWNPCWHARYPRCDGIVSNFETNFLLKWRKRTT